MLACEDVSSSAHICCQLINIVHSIYYVTSEVLIPEISDDELVRRAVCEFVILQVDASHPEALHLKLFDQVAADEPASTAYEYVLADNILHFLPPRI